MIAKLLKNTTGLLAVAGLIAFASCEEASRDYKDNDTKTEATPNADTATTTAVASTPMKKKGRVSAKMEATTKGEFKKDGKGIYSNVEVAPVYPGGETALSNFIADNLEYPADAIDRNVEGTVRVEFVVNENGKVSNAAASGNQVGNGLDKAAVDIVNKMPEWKPGMVNGKPVKTRLVLPVTYKLEE